MIRISKRLLIHSATLSRITQDWTGQEESSIITELTNVRYERKTKMSTTSTNEELALTAKFWFDGSNSSPQGTTFKEKDILTFEGKDHVVEVINIFYDDVGFGHYELGLV